MPAPVSTTMRSAVGDPPGDARRRARLGGDVRVHARQSPRPRRFPIHAVARHPWACRRPSEPDPIPSREVRHVHRPVHRRRPSNRSRCPARVHVAPWLDPVVDRRGHDPRSAYVEQFWLGVLGPTATWLLRRLVAGFDHQPDGYELDVTATARSLGLSRRRRGRRHRSPRRCTRCVMFGLVQRLSRLVARAPADPARLAAPPGRLPDDVQSAHACGPPRPCTSTRLSRAHALATAMLAVGDDRALLEPQLIAVGVPAPAAAEACELLTPRARAEVDREVDQQAGAEAGGALRAPRLVAVDLHRAGDVEVRPRRRRRRTRTGTSRP